MAGHSAVALTRRWPARDFRTGQARPRLKPSEFVRLSAPAWCSRRDWCWAVQPRMTALLLALLRRSGVMLGAGVARGCRAGPARLGARRAIRPLGRRAFRAPGAA